MMTNHRPESAIFDSHYLDRLRAGDPDTAKHFDSYFRRLIQIKVWGRFDLQTQADLIDDVLSSAVEQILKGEPRDAAHLPGYICGICSNLIKLKCRPRITLIHKTFSADQVRALEKTAEESLMEADKATSVRLVLQSLLPRDRSILTDLFLEELPRDEVCAKHGVTRGQLRMILFHARSRFQKEWESRECARRGQTAEKKTASARLQTSFSH